MSARLRHIRRTCRPRTGFALPVALAVLVVTLLLAAVAVAVASSTNSFSNRDTNAQAALAAADAGARTAVYRLNSFAPDDTHCPDPSNDAVGSSGAPTSTLCPPESATLGNGESFTYWMSGGMTSASPCTGFWMTSTLGDLAPALRDRDRHRQRRQRTAPGAHRRIQVLRPVPDGDLRHQSVTINNNVNIQTNTAGSPALLGTNGVLNAAPNGGGNTVIDGYQLPPGRHSTSART